MTAPEHEDDDPAEKDRTQLGGSLQVSVEGGGDGGLSMAAGSGGLGVASGVAFDSGGDDAAATARHEVSARATS